ncbi:MAG TPA: ATP-dependent metallopeptidase FtsH/Yme1/Tma family protein, partial [Acidobacteriaceae bacterium]|nr:ATP-dependent metallopeptidase FtsH/Yme1/Tma family protein [Acidobacteriaceae bacterium]
ISFSTFMDDARQGQVQDVTITNSTVTGHFRNSKDNGFHTTVPANYPDMFKTLQDNKVSITVKEVLERHGLSAAERGVWPVLAVGSSILWMSGMKVEGTPGFQVAVEPFREAEAPAVPHISPDAT